MLQPFLWTSLGLNQGPPDYENDKMIAYDKFAILYETHQIPLTETVCLRIVYAEFERLHIAVEPIAYSTITFINSQCKYRLIF